MIEYTQNNLKAHLLRNKICLFGCCVSTNPLGLFI